MLGRLYPFILPNDENEVSDRTVWKWSSNWNPHLAINTQGQALLTYQSNIKGSKCLSFGEQAGDLDMSRNDVLSTIEAQLIRPQGLRFAETIFRPALTAPDSADTTRTSNECQAIADAPLLLSAYHPVSVADGAGNFQVLYTVEEGSIAELQDDIGTSKRISRTLVTINSQERIEVADETTQFRLYEQISDTLPVSATLGERDIHGNVISEGSHPQADIVFDDTLNIFVVTFDDADGSHILFLDASGEPIDGMSLQRGDNFIAAEQRGNATLIEAVTAGFEPRLTLLKNVPLFRDGGNNLITGSKTGVTFSYQDQGVWRVGQNFLLIYDSAGQLAIELERPVDQFHVLSPALDWSGHAIPEVFPGLAISDRFLTFWVGNASPASSPSLYNSFLPEGSIAGPDADFDGIVDANDNCPQDINPNQANNDKDSTTCPSCATFDNDGDVCDPDDDNDLICDPGETDPNCTGSDAFPFDPAEDTDTDGDGTGNNADTDDDNDGWSDVNEAACGTDPLAGSDVPVDTDGDGTCNVVDTDDDNDGYSDAVELAEGTNPLDLFSTPADNDGDFDPDSTDPDDDNDGVNDGADCEPFNARAYPGAIEYLNTVDNNCDGLLNEIPLSSATVSFVGEAADYYAGHSIASAGDVNGDGFDDILIGATEEPSGGTGRVYLILGSAQPSSINLSSADAVFIGETVGGRTGHSVAGAGDVNGDGFDDILIGANFGGGKW